MNSPMQSLPVCAKRHSEPEAEAAHKLKAAFVPTRNFNRNLLEATGGLIELEVVKGSAAHFLELQARIEAKEKLLLQVNLHHRTNVHRKVRPASCHHAIR